MKHKWRYKRHVYISRKHRELPTFICLGCGINLNCTHFPKWKDTPCAGGYRYSDEWFLKVYGIDPNK